VFENRVLRRTFGSSAMEGWKKLHNEELRNLYSTPSVIRMIKSRMMRGAGHVAQTGEKRNRYRLLVGKPGGKRTLVRPGQRCADNFKVHLGEKGLEGVLPGLVWLRIGTDQFL
jgi:hypothetical protein